jgi:hypothetical protein
MEKERQMQRKRESRVLMQVAMVVLLLLGFVAAAPAGEVQPGDVIDKSNADKAKDYFPPHFMRWITDGWELESPVTVHVVAPVPNPPPKNYMAETAKNATRVEMLPDGKLKGYVAGLPFPDPQEPNKALKIMWNSYYRWRGDDFTYPGGFLVPGKRKNGKLSIGKADIHFLRFTGRTDVDPRPDIPNPHNLEWAMTLDSLEPPEWKGMVTLVWRYNDPTKPDDMWTYLPTMRRTLRLVSRERSNPVRGTTSTWDDYYGFDGKLMEFDYKLVGEQKILAIMNQSTLDVDGHHPILSDNYEIRDAYVVDITSKDPRYPEKYRRVWVIKETYWVVYSESFDKTGQFWKACVNTFHRFDLPNGDHGPFNTGNSITDFKTGTWVGNFIRKLNLNNSKITPASFEPGSLNATGM